MPRKGAVKRKAVFLPIPRNLSEANEAMRRIGEEQRALEAMKQELIAKIEALKAEAAKEALSCEKRIQDFFEGLFVFAESQRSKLTSGGYQKTVELPAGSFGWRKTPPKVTIEGVKEVIEALKKMQLERFIRTKEEPDREAMLKEPDVAGGVAGVSISQHEEFFAKPAEVELELTGNTKTLTKKLVS